MSPNGAYVYFFSDSEHLEHDPDSVGFVLYRIHIDSSTLERAGGLAPEVDDPNWWPAVDATGDRVVAGGVRPHRDVEDPARYNAVARRVMAEHGIPVNDLHGLAAGRMDELMRPVDVHFTRAGSRVLAG